MRRMPLVLSRLRRMYASDGEKITIVSAVIKRKIVGEEKIDEVKMYTVRHVL